MKKLKTLIIISILSSTLFCFEITNIVSVGKLINIYSPCEQNLQNSFPCYAIYDLYFMFLIFGIVAVCVICIVTTLIKKNKVLS